MSLGFSSADLQLELSITTFVLKKLLGKGNENLLKNYFLMGFVMS